MTSPCTARRVLALEERVRALEACFAAVEDWIALRFEGELATRVLDERLAALRAGAKNSISDLEAADQWCREHGATVRYIAPEEGPFRVEVLAEWSARSYRGSGRTLPEAVGDAQMRLAQVAAVGAE